MGIDVNAPNLKRMFVPSPGRIFVDIDLERADAQVVAWDADVPTLKEAFRRGDDIHTINASMLYEVEPEAVTKQQRDFAKRFCHAANYMVSAATLASSLRITKAEAQRSLNRWFSANPQIKDWHRRIETQLASDKTVWNAFGYRRIFTGRIDHATVKEALAWIPQSTVALATNRGYLRVEEEVEGCDFVVQVHDSVLFELREDLYPDILPTLAEKMQVPVPYPDPLTIPVSMDIGLYSWGTAQGIDWRNPPSLEELQTDEGEAWRAGLEETG